jgi:hypothetical protein
MAITIWDYGRDAKRFTRKKWHHIKISENQELIGISGVAIIDFKGVSSNWKKEKLNLLIRNPVWIPANKQFQVDQWTPFITLNAIYNRGHAVNAGWAVDDFGGPGRVKVLPRGHIPIWADIAIRDVDGMLFRIGYHLTLVGRLVDYEQSIPD